MSIKCVDFLFSRLSESALRRGWHWVPSPPDLVRQIFRDSTSEGEKFDELAARNREDMDGNKSAYLGPYSILLGSIGSSADSVERMNLLLEQHHRRAAWARSWLDGKRKENLYLFLCGPPGALDVAEEGAQRTWLDVAYKFERDERICRKLVWLPPRDEQSWATSADEFLERTVLAEPWCRSELALELDPLKPLQSANAVPAKWWDLLQSDEYEANDLALLLIQALREQREVH